MKKLLSIILTFIFLLTLIGCTNEKDKKDENGSEKKTAVVKEYKTEKTYKANAEKQPIEAGEIEVLTEEDRAVKAEIAKYSDTKVDFRNKKQEKIGNKNYELTFDRVGYTEIDKENVDRITYISTYGDEFVYNANTGKLRFVSFLSNNLAKEDVNTVIDITAAEKIAYEHVSQVCDIDKYTLNESKEIFNGYSFQYSVFINGYRTANNVRITIGFGGNIVYIGIFTDTFDGIDLNINKDWIEKKTNEALAKCNGANPIVKDKLITVEDGKPCLEVIISYEKTLSGKVTQKNAVYLFDFEQ